MAVGERCPACGHMPVAESPRTMSREEQLTAWTVELTRAAIVPGMETQEIGHRLRAIHAALQGLHDGPASDPPPAA